MQWLGHVQKMSSERTQKRVFRCRPVGKKRQTRGASLRLVDTMSRDFSWIEYCMDRCCDGQTSRERCTQSDMLARCTRDSTLILIF